MNKRKRKHTMDDLMKRFVHFGVRGVIDDSEFLETSEALGGGQTLVLDTETGIAYQGFVSGGTAHCGNIRGDVACFLGLRTL